MNKRKINLSVLLFISSVLVILAAFWLFPDLTTAEIDQQRIFSYLKKQMEFGPRIPMTAGHADFVNWASGEFAENQWNVTHQKGKYQDKEIINIIASRDGTGSDDQPWLLIGAHYDTRTFATSEADPEKQKMPVPGANDGASGVAVLMELANTLPRDLDKKVWLVLFDAEDQGDIPGWDHWCLGSTLMAKEFDAKGHKPDAVVIADMIGDSDLQIYRENNSDPNLTNEIWALAADLGYQDVFIDKPKYSIYDDHIPFLKIGIPAVDLIDFDYPAWHTLEDDLHNVSAESLAAVAQVLAAWIKQ